MSEKVADDPNEVVEFKIDNAENLMIPTESLTVRAETSSIAKDADKITQVESAKDDEPKPTMYHGVIFPAYFQGPHFVEVKGSLVMAIDPRCVTMGMKSNWERYRHELAALGKKVVEKSLNIKIETV